MKKNKKRGIEALKSRYGYQFVAHWVLGLVLFFIIPIINSIRYSFSEITVGTNGLKMGFVGINHYKDMLLVDSQYLNNLVTALADMFTSLPIIFALSLILAVVLNQRFKGRVLARCIFFLPVIIATGVVMTVLSSPYIHAPLFNVTSGAEYEYGGLIDFNSILVRLNLPEQIVALFAKYLSNVFDLIWSCGIQIVLFLSGLQSIPNQLYEVSKIEGATKWEEFCYMTIPMLKDVILLVLVYTMIDLFTAVDNPVIQQAYSIMKNNQIYDKSSAMMWGYFLVVGIVMGAVLLIYNRFCLKKWE